MKRNIWLLALVGAILWGQAAWAQDFYVVAVGGVGTRISAVPYTISAPGFYYLGADLTHTGATNAITVNVDNVTIDLMGFSLTHTGATGNTAGIFMSARTNVEVRNGTVRGFNDGVRETAGNKHRIINVRSNNNASTGMSLTGASHQIKGCNTSNNGNGISVQSGIISDCVATNNINFGIALGSGTIADCLATNNPGIAGIHLTGPGSVLGNTAFANTARNFELGGAGVPTSILVDRNSAFGLNPNYTISPTTTGVVITGNNAGTP
jgi:hypothetical protein